MINSVLMRTDHQAEICVIDLKHNFIILQASLLFQNFYSSNMLLVDFLAECYEKEKKRCEGMRYVSERTDDE